MVTVGAGGRFSLRRLMVAVSVGMIALTGWASGAGAQQSPESTTPAPQGPRANLSHGLYGGNGVFLADPIPVDLHRYGYVQHEYLATGTASSYQATSPFTQNGRWSFAPSGSAPYRTRVVVRQPATPQGSAARLSSSGST